MEPGARVAADPGDGPGLVLGLQLERPPPCSGAQSSAPYHSRDTGFLWGGGEGSVGVTSGPRQEGQRVSTKLQRCGSWAQWVGSQRPSLPPTRGAGPGLVTRRCKQVPSVTAPKYSGTEAEKVQVIYNSKGCTDDASTWIGNPSDRRGEAAPLSEGPGQEEAGRKCIDTDATSSRRAEGGHVDTAGMLRGPGGTDTQL